MSDDYDYLMTHILILILRAQLTQIELLNKLVEERLPVFRPPDLVYTSKDDR